MAIRGTSYYTLVGGGTWTEVEDLSISLGGNLVAINDSEENQWLHDNNFHGWIGFTDVETEGDWKWSNGDPVTFVSWFPGEPNNVGNEDYASKSSLVWGDSNNSGYGNGGLMKGVAEIPLSYFSISDLTLNEGDSGNITISRTGGSNQVQNLTITSSDGTATFGSDYRVFGSTAPSEIIRFSSGETSKTINISALSDTLDESDETFNLILSASESDDVPAQITDSTALITIQNVDESDNGDASFAISGTPKDGETLSIIEISADPDGTGGLSYLWESSSDKSSWSTLSTSSSYQVQAEDEGKYLRVQLSYTDDHNNSESIYAKGFYQSFNFDNNNRFSSFGIKTIDPGENNVTDFDIRFSTGSTTAAYMYSSAFARSSQSNFDDFSFGSESLNYNSNWKLILDGEIAIFQDDVYTVVQLINSYRRWGDGDSIDGMDIRHIQYENDDSGSGWLEAQRIFYSDSGDAVFEISGTNEVGETLSVSETTADPDGTGSLSYIWESSSDGSSWSQISTSSTYTLTSSEEGKKVRSTLSYTDDQGFSESITATAIDILHTPPTITGPSNNQTSGTSAGITGSTITINENSTTVYTFAANETVTWDFDDSALYGSGGRDVSKFSINSSTGALTFSSAPDYEMPTDYNSDNDYVVVVRATDSAGNASLQPVTVTITNVDEINPSLSSSSPADNATAVATTSNIVLNFSETVDVESGSIVIYDSSSNSNGLPNLFEQIDITSSQVTGTGTNKITINPGSNFLENTSYYVQIAATAFDDSSSNSYAGISDTTTLSFTTADETAPTISGPSGSAGETKSSKSINENVTTIYSFTADETVTWSLNGGADASLFSINSSSGALSFSSAPDYESPEDSDSGNDYVVVIRATDAVGNTSDQTVTVSVADVDEVNQEPTYRIFTSINVPQENYLLTTTAQTSNVSVGTKLYWSISGTNVNIADFAAGSMNGKGIVGSDGSFSFEHLLANDGAMEGYETFDIKLFSDNSLSTQVGLTKSILIRDSAVTEQIAEINSQLNTITELLTVGQEYALPNIRDYDGNLHANTETVSEDVKTSYKYQGLLDVNKDGTKEAIYTNNKSGRWVTASVNSTTGLTDYSDYGKDGTTRVVGIYIDPLVTSGEVEQFGPHDSQRRFQNDLKIDNLIAKTSGDYDGDGFQEVYWKTNDGTAYLRALMHADGNIQYSNYQSEEQMSDYLTSKGYASEISNII